MSVSTLLEILAISSARRVIEWSLPFRFNPS